MPDDVNLKPGSIVDKSDNMVKKQIALEFREEEEFRKALSLLGKIEGKWALPGLLTVIVEAGDIHYFQEANLVFDRLPVVPAPLVSAEERREARAAKR